MLNFKKYFPFILLFSLPVQAELSSLNDAELSEVDGEGINFVLEDYVYSSVDAEVSIKDISGTDSIDLYDLYIMGAGSDSGSTITPVTLGRLENPYSLDVVDIEGGSNKGLLFDFPDYVPGLGADVGLRGRYVMTSGQINVWENITTGFSLDGSSLRLWGNGTETLVDINLHLHMDTFDVESFTCPPGTPSCDIANVDSSISTVHMTNFDADLRFGHGDIFALNFGVTPAGTLLYTAKGLNATNAADYYATPKSHISIDNVTFGGSRLTPTTPAVTGGINIGESHISGIRLQYLELESHDI